MSPHVRRPRTKILHINNIANVARTLAAAQTALGHDAKVLVRWGSEWPGDLQLPTRGDPVTWNIAILRRWRALADADVVHIHGGIWRSQIAYGVLRRILRDTVFVVHLHGTDARTGRGLHHMNWANVVLVSTPDLARLVPSARYIPNPVAFQERTQPPTVSGVAIFGHFPTHRELKGTAIIEKAFRTLAGSTNVAVSRGQGIEKLMTDQAELWIVEGVMHDRALELMQQCDVVVDSITQHGAHGIVSIEGMASGKVVVCSYDPPLLPGVPVVRASEDDLAAVFRDLLERRAEWPKIGDDGRQYAKRVHDASAVAGQHIRIYYEQRSRDRWDRKRATEFWLNRGRTYIDEFAREHTPSDAERFRLQEAGLRRVLEQLPFQDFVEVGSGFGRITKILLGRPGVRGWASDVSLDQLRAARTYLGGIASPLIRSSAASLPFKSHSVDLVIASEVLMHLPPKDMQMALAEMARVARRHIVNLDWYEPYAVGAAIPWCWNHDYPGAYRELRLDAKETRPYDRSLQRIFVASL